MLGTRKRHAVSGGDMPTMTREKTKYPGVYAINGTDPVSGKPEKIFYIVYRKAGKQIEEKAGRSNKPDLMTAAKASAMRGARIKGAPSNEEKRAVLRAEKGRMTIGKIWAEYEMHRTRRKSIKADTRLYALRIRPVFGDKVPEEVDPLSLDRFRAKLGKIVSEKTGKPFSPATIHHTMALLRQIVNFGIQRRLTKGLPSKVPVPPVGANMVTEYLTPDETAAFIKALDEDPDQDAADALRLAMLTGARKMEILKLRWEDVDLERGVWMLRDRKDYGDAGFPLPPRAVEILELRYKMRDEKSPFVFPGRAEDGFQKQFRLAAGRIKKAAKLPAKFRIFHGLRHHYASSMVSAGVDLYVVSKLLGHSDPTLTARRYAHLRPGVLADAAQLAGRLVGVAEQKAKEKEQAGTA
jgi:integrase